MSAERDPSREGNVTRCSGRVTRRAARRATSSAAQPMRSASVGDPWSQSVQDVAPLPAENVPSGSGAPASW